ncbi:MAG: sugar MFS transporter [Bacteroidales bacterium]|nr:sugar MFS transporter [Bacteroidales bacterium]
MRKRSASMVILVLVTFFVISFLTNVLGPLIPDIIDNFSLSLGLAGFLPFSFFVAYGVMSIPAGILTEKYTEKPVLIAAFVLAFLGALLFAMFPKFSVALISLFMIGIGMAMLQVIINPLLRVSGGESNYAFYSAMAQLIFGLASFLSPLLYSYLVHNVHSGNTSFAISILDKLVPENLKWVSLYWVFTVITLVMIIINALIKFPKVELTEEERIEVGHSFKELFSNKYVILFFFSIFAYVGTEQGIANWASKFLQTYHGVDPTTQGATAISWFWGLMTIGCFIGMGLLKIFDSKSVLLVFTAGAIIALLVALFGSREVSLIAFPLTGFFAAVMYPVTFSLALNSVPKHHGTFAGILCTGIAGGALVPLLIGGLAELVGLRYAMFFIFVTLGYIFSTGIWAKPIITNATMNRKIKDLFRKAPNA